MNTVINFAKVNPNAIIPTKLTEDMGFDIYPCFDQDYIIIKSHETKLIPTGIASSCDPEYGFLLRERGSTGSKGIALRCGVIDSGYRGEWFIGLTNTTENLVIISKTEKKLDIIDKERSSVDGFFDKAEIYEKVNDALIYPYSKAIAQALIIPVPSVTVVETEYDVLKTIESKRGIGKLGSSNK